MPSENTKTIHILCVAQITALEQYLIWFKWDALATTENKVALKLIEVLIGRFTLNFGAHDPIEHFFVRLILDVALNFLLGLLLLQIGLAVEVFSLNIADALG